jgi:hypothetical protein
METPRVKSAETVQACIDELYKLNDWYKHSYKSCTIENLSHARAKMVTYNATLSTFVAESKNEVVDTEHALEMSFNKLNITNLDSGESIARAKSTAILSTEKEREAFNLAKKYFTYISIFHANMNNVIDAMSQDIATMKKEERQSRIL